MPVIPTPFPGLPLTGGTISGPLTVTGPLTTQAGISNSGGSLATTGNTNISASGVGTVTAAAVFANLGSVDVQFAGGGLRVKEGANCKQGTATLAAGTVTVANTAV